MKKYSGFTGLLLATLFALAACAQPPAVPPTAVPATEATEAPVETATAAPTEEPTATVEATTEATEEPAEAIATPEADNGAGATDDPSIAGVVSRNARFTTLARALETAGLVETLQGDVTFTVFAPTDEAFAQLNRETLDALFDDPETLEEILIYHVIEGETLAAEVVGADEIITVRGDIITVTVEDETVTLNDSAEVIETDIIASNGIIHIIDNILLPPDVELP